MPKKLTKTRTRRSRKPVGSVRALAQRIADGLFVNGAGNRAGRLVLEMPGGLLGRLPDGTHGSHGGWCEKAAVDRIEGILKAPNDKAHRCRAEDARTRVRRNPGIRCSVLLGR